MDTPRICPKCGKPYTEPPALSRKDNQTQICRDCGLLESLVIAGISKDLQQQILDTVHNYTPSPAAAATA